MATGPGSSFTHGPTCGCRGCALERRVSELEVAVTAQWERIAQLEKQIGGFPVLQPATSPLPAEMLPGTIMCSAGQADTTALLMNAADEYDELMSGQPGWMP